MSSVGRGKEKRKEGREGGSRVIFMVIYSFHNLFFKPRFWCAVYKNRTLPPHWVYLSTCSKRVHEHYYIPVILPRRGTEIYRKLFGLRIVYNWQMLLFTRLKLVLSYSFFLE